VIDINVTDQGALLLSIKLSDENDTLLAEIKENEWRSGEVVPWDIQFQHRKLTIRCAPRKIALKVDSQVDPISIQGEIWGGGKLMKIDSTGIHVDQAHLIGSGKVTGFVVDLDSRATGFRLVPRTS
jgi:hypothetical protein